MAENLNSNPPSGIRLSFVARTIFVGLLVIGGAVFGYYFGHITPQSVMIEGVANIDGATTTAADFSQFWRVWQKIDEEYLRSEEVDSESRVYGAIKGLVGSLGDPYSEFFDPADNKRFSENIQGDFGGIGAELSIRKNVVVVVAPMKDTPAMKAGLLAGDMILEVNSSSTENKTIDEVVGWIRGKPGTEVKLMIFREGWEKTKEFKLERATIKIPTIDYQMKEGKIGYVQLYGFNANAAELFYEASLSLARDGMKGMVLDLRNNPGGYLEIAVDIAGWFVPKKAVVVSETRRSNEKNDFRASGNEAFLNLPVVVLINGGSASASEILAGALRDIRNAKLVGEKSFGKGVVQEAFPLPGGSSVKLTIAHWLTPKGDVIEGKGLKPDIEIKIEEEDYENKKDPQLEKALSLIKDEIQ